MSNLQNPSGLSACARLPEHGHPGGSNADSNAACPALSASTTPHIAILLKLRTAIVVLLGLQLVLSISFSQAPGRQSPRLNMRSHYDAAYRLQSEGKLVAADVEHEAFLVDALSELANGYANAGDYARAAPIFDEALALSPHDSTILRDYGAASIDAQAYSKAQQLLSEAIESAAGFSSPRRLAELHRLRGDASFGMLGKAASLSDYSEALALDGSCDNFFALASAQLAKWNLSAAASSFSNYLAHCGDSPGIRLKIGRAYALNGLPDRAVEEFKKALAEDSRYPDAHYCLGAAYLAGSKTAFDRAAAEFHEELALHPNDRYSYAQLGHIALMRHQDHEAEADYRHAIESNPADPTNYIQLGQLFETLGREREAEPLLRRAIELTSDPSRDHYQIVKAYYALARIHHKDGQQAEAQGDLKMAEALLQEGRKRDELRLSDATPPADPLAKTRIPTPEQAKAIDRLAKELGPLVAGSYNNLGVHAAMASHYAIAAHDFRLARQWDSSLSGVDMNLGRAAYLAYQWKDAVDALERASGQRPSDDSLRRMLAEARRQLRNSERP